MTLDELKVKYDCGGHIEKNIPIPEKPHEGLVLLVGTSGSGKSTILKSWFPNYASQQSPDFTGAQNLLEAFESIDGAVEMLNAFGLRTVPAWFRPRNTLSNGEGHRADCALAIHRGAEFVDEFTSVVDRDTAKSLSCALRKYHKTGLLVLATCHHDVEDWLQPDIVYDCDLREFRCRRLDRRPQLNIEIRASTIKDWVYFSKYHYLTSDISKSCHCYTAYIGEKPIAFYATIHACNRDIPSFWRGSRLVVLPEFQGFGIGVIFADTIASEYVSRGMRFFEKTANIPIGEYRNRSEAWRATSTNMMRRRSYMKDGKPRLSVTFGKTAEAIIRDSERICYSHELMYPIFQPPAGSP